MKRALLSAILIGLLCAQFSCKGVKNMSGTLNKSEPGSGKDYNRDGYTDYSKVSAGTSAATRDSLNMARTSQRAPVSGYANAVSPVQPATGDTYRKDYGRISNGQSENPVQAGSGVTPGYAEVNDRLVRQYAEMDRLADLVLYELTIVEKRWDMLLAQYKSASPADKERISADLDQLNADQLKLYRAHVRIYRDGKTDWVGTKRDVDATLLSVRGLGSK